MSVSQTEYTKTLHAKASVVVCKKFCEINNIPEPIFNIYEGEEEGVTRIKRVGTCGYYRKKNIHVAIPLCARQNAMYSWPGYISDRTPYGVIAHELGHYVDEYLTIRAAESKGLTSLKGVEWISSRVVRLSKEKSITSYDPNDSEIFAEWFRLFITNPGLLRLIRPGVYREITALGLKPRVTMIYKDVLDFFKAPDRIYTRLEATYKKSQKNVPLVDFFVQ